jgi:hypothetical protein
MIEAALSPEGAIIKSPDKIKDKVTGEFREVDASIRLDVGSTEILVIIECRERSKKQDVIWIEQLATKQKNIGAHKTVAVTSKGLSSQAMKKAAYYEIAVRKLERINIDSIFKWLEYTYRHYKHETYGFVLDTGNASQLKKEKPIEELTVFNKEGKEILVDDILYELWDLAFTASNFPKKNIDNKLIQSYKYAMRLPPKQYFFKTDTGMTEWTDVVFYFSLETTVKNILRDGFAYSSSDDILMTGYTYELPEFDNRDLFHIRVDFALKENPKPLK